MLESIKHILPEIYLCSLALIALLRGMFEKDEQKAFNKSFLAIILAFIATLLIYRFGVPHFEIMGSFPLDNGEFLFTSYNLIVFVKILILICSMVLMFLFKDELARLEDKKHEYLFLFAMCIVGGFIAVSTFNLFVIFVGIELISFCLYILFASIGRDNQKVRASGRYFVVSSLASGIILYGISLAYLSCQTVDIGGLGFCLSKTGDLLSNFKLYLSISLVTIGVLVKLGIFPFQYYLPAIAQRSNRVVLGTVVTIVKIVFLAIVLHGMLILGLEPVFIKILSFAVIIGLLFSAIMSYGEQNVDRLIAYSSIHNTSFVLLGIFMLDYKLFIYYQTLYALLILSFLSFLVSFNINSKPVKTFKELALALGSSGSDKFFGFAILILISGSPPVGIFFGKFLVVKELIYKEQYLFGFLAALGGVLMIGCFLRIMREIFVYYSSRHKPVQVTRNNSSKYMSYALLIIAVAFSFVFLY